MRCPHCAINLEQAIIANTEIDYCPRCYGLWFERDELRWAKDERDRDLRWLDIDLWKDPAKFKLSKEGKRCPKDRMPLYETRYGDAPIKVDVCNLCHGVWLDRGEFKEIMSYLREELQEETLHKYVQNLLQETWEVFSGPDLLKEELLDVWALLKLLRYKFAAQHPHLARAISALPR